jgi:aldehyde dehydrogenase (NAD+)
LLLQLLPDNVALPKPIMDFAAASQRQRALFQTGATRSVEFRRAQLERLAGALERHEAALLSALQADLRKSPMQGYTTEIGLVQAEICHAQKHLARWAAPERRRTPWFVAPARGWVQSEPFGMALILGPWDYPVQLVVSPLVSAIAAGNCVALKPSELAPRTAEVMVTLLRGCFAEEYVSVATGGPDAAEALLRERFDKLFFTGSTRVGRLVMAAAAKHLTPVTLELGGECPAIVCADAPVKLAACRIAWGKFMNAGQTCVAPDFVLVPREARDPFVAPMKKALHKFYGDDPARCEDYGHIVKQAHFERLVNYLRDGKAVHGGQHDAKDLFIAPTILADMSPDAPAMQEESHSRILALSFRPTPAGTRRPTESGRGSKCS